MSAALRTFSQFPGAFPVAGEDQPTPAALPSPLAQADRPTPSSACRSAEHLPAEARYWGARVARRQMANGLDRLAAMQRGELTPEKVAQITGQMAENLERIADFLEDAADNRRLALALLGHNPLQRGNPAAQPTE